MYNNLLATNEILRRNEKNEEELDTKLCAYQVFIEEGVDKEGEKLFNRDGSIRYFAINDEEVYRVETPIRVKKISDNFYKKIIKVEGEDTLLEKITQKEGRVVYYPVLEDSLETIEEGTVLRCLRNDCYRELKEEGYAVFDSTEEKPRLLFVKKFETDDYKSEVENVLKSMPYRHKIQ